MREGDRLSAEYTGMARSAADEVAGVSSLYDMYWHEYVFEAYAGHESSRAIMMVDPTAWRPSR